MDGRERKGRRPTLPTSRVVKSSRSETLVHPLMSARSAKTSEVYTVAPYSTRLCARKVPTLPEPCTTEDGLDSKPLY